MTLEARFAAAAAIGLGLGFVLARGEFCVVSALNQAILFRGRRLLGGFVVAAAVVAAGTALSLQAGGTALRQVGVGTVAAPLLGGLLFGVGMALAGGCVSGTLFRAGAGYVHFWLVLVAMMAGIVLRASLVPAGRIGSGSVVGSLYDVAGGAPPILIGAAALAVLVAVAVAIDGRRGRWRTWLGAGAREVRPARGRSMPIEPRGAGLALGALLLAQGLLVAPIGFTHGVVGATEVFRGGPVRHGVELMLVSGTIVGATFCAWKQGTLAIRWPPLRRIPGALGGGLIMGFGAAIAPGCNVGILLGSVPALGIHGLLVGTAMVVGFTLVALARRRGWRRGS